MDIPVSRASPERCRRIGACRLGVQVLFTAALVAGCSAATGNPPTEESSGLVAAPAQVQEVLVNSCYDCHSDRAAAAWNTDLAPSYLFGAGKARQTLNFSQWQSYSAQRRSAEMAAIAKAVEDGSMPPDDYNFVHPSGRLEEEQKRALLTWVSQQSPQPAH